MRLGGTQGGDIAVLNVYASNCARQRCVLWEWLLSSLPCDCRWMRCSDWNFVEHQADKSTFNGRIISVDKSRVFSLLKNALGVEDSFPNNSTLKFSWDNKCYNGLRSLACLDRCYSFLQCGAGPSPITSYFILGNARHSNHLPVSHIAHPTLQVSLQDE